MQPKDSIVSAGYRGRFRVKSQGHQANSQVLPWGLELGDSP